jgi:hypothetical protein
VDEFEGKHTHPDEVRAVDSFERFRDHRTDAEKRGSFRRPVARRPGAVLLSGDDHQWCTATLILHGCIVDRYGFRARLGDCPATFSPVRELVTQPDVREGATDHDLVIAATRTVRVEILGLHLLRNEPFTGRRRGGDRARW